MGKLHGFEVASEKSSAFAPLKAMDEIVTGAFPVLEMPTGIVLEVDKPCAANVMGFGLMLSADESACPVPLKEMLCGDPAALSLTVKAAERAPLAVGLNATYISQE